MVILFENGTFLTYSVSKSIGEIKAWGKQESGLRRGDFCMSKYKRVTITSLAIVLSILFIGSTALCKPPEDKPGKEPPGKSELELIITDDGGTPIVNVTLTVGTTSRFLAKIEGDESIDMSQIDVKWRVLGAIGEITPDGLFTATKAARGLVEASAKVDKKSLKAHVVVKVAEGEPPPGEGKRIVVAVTPDFMDLAPGERTLEPFTATPDGDTQWRVVPPRIGYIEQDGSKCWFTAGANTGKGIVIATVQTQGGKGTGRARVVVVGGNLPLPGPKLKLNVTPKHARVDNDGSVEFEAKVAGPKAHYVPEWEVNPSESGEIEGEGERIIFNAASKFKGRALVIAKIQTETEFAMDWATVDIGGPGKFPSKVKISVAPEECSMVVDETKEFTANGVSTDQIAQLTWSVAPKRLGIIDDAGNFTPNAPGWGLIIAKLDTEKGVAVGKAKVYVGSTGITVGSLPLAIKIEPLTPTATTVNGDSVEFQVLDMQTSNPVTDTPIQWKAVPSSLGSIIETEPSKAEFTPGSKAGYVLITAKVVGPKGSATAQARVTISIGRLEVEVSGELELVTNGTYTYTASVQDSEGNPVDRNELEFKWRLAPPSIGKLTGDFDTATFTPRKAGRCVIVVDVQGPQGTGTGRISITVNE